ncbi:DNA-directed RNA polymerase, mitochondrial-like [Watersipora subatra]|uniref:DNA-directed RNA polymerase, mitochondrial-like n=1 Tax=Watersipora subatra TaxID=2589382 RepID=UPI00355C9C2E
MSVQSLLPLLKSAANHPSLRAYPAAMSQLREDMMSLHPNFHMESRNAKPDKLRYSNVLVNELNEPMVLKNSSAGVLPVERATKLLDDHMASENEGLVEIESVVPVQINEDVARHRDQYKAMMRKWKLSLEREFSQLLRSFDAEVHDEISSRFRLSEFLQCLPTDQIVSVMLRESERLCEMSDYYSPNLTYLAFSLGKGVRCKYISHMKSHTRASELEAMHRRYMQAYNSASHRDTFRVLYEDTDESSLLELTEDQVWPDSVTHLIGEALYKLILNSLTVPGEMLEETSDQPVLAFYTVDRFNGVKRAKQVKPHPSIVRAVNEAKLRRHIIEVDCVPMVIPPVPWRVQHRGPFLLSNNPLVRSIRGNYFGESSDQELLPVFDALNVLGAVPWKINNAVYPHLLNVFNSGGDAKLKVPISEEKVALSDKSKENLSDEEVDALLKKSQAEAFSERVSFELALSVANHFKNGTFWMPHDVDFRGRAYPISRYLSQVSSDPLRAILTFAKGQPLGERGLDWLKIHLVNLSGFKKKESTTTRLAFADEVLPLALQSAARPLEGKQWWQDLDSPWQGLAACMELKAAFDSGDPVNYLSTLPVHQDGSCNGLQHYAALGGDTVGASAVNLLPADRPHDTYQDVANRAELCRARDAANGNPIAQMLEGHITRKVVKQTVMTKVYGVTQYGSKLQIYKHLSEQSPGLGSANLQKASAYLSSKLFESMASMFISSTEIQNWLTLCAQEITTTVGKPVSWKTPLGLSVTQNYWTGSLKADKDGQSESGFTDLHHDASVERPDVNKNRNGFPPNFIHSLDASHMMLTALRCHRHGITFASIHDCFWTHANSIDTMNKICRESFYDIHSQPILSNLSDYFVKNYINPDDPEHEFLGRLVRSVIPKGNLDLSLVKKSEYFFS